VAIVRVAGSGEGVPEGRWEQLAAVVSHRPGSAAATLQLTALASHFHRLGDKNGTRALNTKTSKPNFSPERPSPVSTIIGTSLLTS
jgi:hypothetical protein